MSTKEVSWLSCKPEIYVQEEGHTLQKSCENLKDKSFLWELTKVSFECFYTCGGFGFVVNHPGVEQLSITSKRNKNKIYRTVYLQSIQETKK